MILLLVQMDTVYEKKNDEKCKMNEEYEWMTDNEWKPLLISIHYLTCEIG